MPPPLEGLFKTLPPPQLAQRLGPRPLPLHLTAEALVMQMCFAGLTPWSKGSPLSNPINQALDEILGSQDQSEPQNRGQKKSPPNAQKNAQSKPWTERVDPKAFLDALTRVSQDQMAKFAAGVASYQGHAHRRVVSPPHKWTGSTIAPVLRYGTQTDGPPVLVVPSLINKSYVLDLFEDRSFMRHLAARGLTPYLLDWTDDSVFRADATVDDYISKVLVPVIADLKRAHGQPPAMVGYCMGGTLATAPPVLRPDLVSALVLLAAPWNFHQDSDGLRHWLSRAKPSLEATLQSLGQAPVDLLQALFAGLDPTLTGRKFRSFAEMDQASDQAKRFVVLEDWLNDGVPLAGPVAKACLLDWYLENAPKCGRWLVDGIVVAPEKITCPTLAVIPARDRIVPPKSAESLASLVPGATVRSVALGHIGMMTGRRAVQEVYDPVADWIINAATQK